MRVFDALSLMAAGYSDAVAIFGVDGLRWEWVKARRVVFCLDRDAAGERWRELAWEGILRGKEVYFLPPAAYAGYKDLNEAWVATGQLDIGAWEEPGWDIGAVADRIGESNHEQNKTAEGAHNGGAKGLQKGIRRVPKEPQNSGEIGAEQGQADELEPIESNQPEHKKENGQAERQERTEPNELNPYKKGRRQAAGGTEEQKKNGELERIKRIESEFKKEKGPAIMLEVWNFEMSAQGFTVPNLWCPPLVGIYLWRPGMR